jgi:hypothetical protein
MLIFIQDDLGATRQLDATPACILRTQIGVGAVQDVILRASDGSCWQLKVDGTGIPYGTAVAADPSHVNALEFYSVANMRFVLSVRPDGVFRVAGGAGNPAEAGAQIALLDIQAADGTCYYWSDVAGVYDAVIGGGTQAYKPWIRSIGPMRQSKDARTDAGDIVVQNVSGNSIERDVAAAMRDREFAGALAVLRVLDAETLEVKRQYDGYFGQPQSDQNTATFRLRALNDSNRIDVPVWDYAEQCQFRYKSKACGSVSGLPTCPKTFTACVARGVQERFPGIPVLPQTSSV